MKLKAILAVAALLCGTAQADVVKGRIVDAETREPLPEAMVQVQIRFENSTWNYGLAVDSLGRFTGNVSGNRCTLTAKLIGYHPTKRTLMAGEMNDTLDLGDIEMRPSDILLRQATVQAKVKRFTMHGDTVVFNPAAFNLEDGARLDDLIRKLPGVTSKDGKLYWDGKPLRILMNGEEMFADNSLLTNRLPAEAVQNIKAYNKASHEQEQTGHDDGEDDRVLDITIKPGFLDRWYGDITAGCQTEDGYLGQLDAYYLSTRDPFMAFGNWNNVNDNYYQKTFGSSSSGSHDPYGKQLFGAVAYKHQIKKPQGTKDLNRSFSPAFSLGHTDSWGTTWTDRETFNPGTDRTFSVSSATTHQHEVTPSLSFQSYIQPDTSSYIHLYANVDYTHRLTLSDDRTGRFADNPYLLADTPLADIFAPQSDPALLRSLAARSRYLDQGKHDEAKASLNSSYDKFFRDKSRLRLSAELSYSHDKAESSNRRQIDYPANAAANLLEQQLGRSPSHSFDTDLRAQYSRWLNKRVELTATYAYIYKNSHERRDLFDLHRLAAYDGTSAVSEADLQSVRNAADSYRRSDVETDNRFRLAATIDLKPIMVKPSVGVYYNAQRLGYRRAALDTVAVDNEWLWNPRLQARWKVSKGAAWEAKYDYSIAQPDLLARLHYTDTTDPLLVVRGNPALSNTGTHLATLQYTGNFQKHQESVIAAFELRRTVNPLQTVYAYNPQTGVYTTWQDNVRGGTDWTGKFSYERALGTAFTLRNDFDLTLGRNYGYLAAASDGQVPQLNRADVVQVSEKPELSFEADHLEITLGGTYDYRHRKNTLSFNYNNNLIHYGGELSAEYKMGQFALSTALKANGYHGYAMSAMNRFRPIWNARVSYKVLGGKGRFDLYADDILDKANYFEAMTTASERTETRYEWQHHFVRLTFTWHFDAKKTKEGREREKHRQTWAQ